MTEAQRYPIWYKLLIDAVQLLQEDKRELSVQRTRDALQAACSIRDVNEKARSLLSIYDFVKCQYCAQSLKIDRQLQTDPFFIVALNIARILASSNDSVFELECATATCTNTSEALMRLARECEWGREHDTADLLFERALKINPHTFGWEITCYADILREHNRLDAAEKLLNFVMCRPEPDSLHKLQAWLNLALCHVLKKEFKKADQCYRKIYSVRHMWPEPLEDAALRYARVLRTVGKLTKADLIEAELRPTAAKGLTIPDGSCVFYMDDPRN
jgi:tetratricopeptide (TPR) repeat protein